MEGSECKMIYYCQTFILKSQLILEAEDLSQSLARLMEEHKQQQLTQHFGGDVCTPDRHPSITDR